MGTYQVINGQYQGVTGHYQVVNGHYQVVSGQYQVVIDQYQVVIDQYQLVIGQYQLIIRQYQGRTGLTKTWFWSRNGSPWLRLSWNSAQMDPMGAPRPSKSLPEPKRPTFEPK